MNFGAYTPDYKALIAGDAGLQFAAGQLQAGHITDLTSRNAAIQRAYVSAGLPIDLTGTAAALGLSPGDLATIIDPTTQQLAQQNTAAGTSTEARLAQAHSDAVRNLKNALNSRGLLGSGETGYQLNREQQNYTQGEYDAKQKLLDYLTSYNTGYAQAEAARQAQLAQAASEAATRQAGLHQPSAGTTAQLVGHDANGNPIYKAADGSLHTFKDPNDPNSEIVPYVPPAPTPPPDFGRSAPVRFQTGVAPGNVRGSAFGF